MSYVPAPPTAFARTYPATASTPAVVSPPAALSTLAYRLLIVVAVPALVVTLGVALLMLGQTELLARIIIGCVLVVVFGTPALCLLAFLVCCFWLVARAGRSRRPVSRTTREVMFDD